QRARRIIEIEDGRVISDRLNPGTTGAAAAAAATEDSASPLPSWWRSHLDRFREAARMALLAMNAHRLRAFLTMLGIIIGVASVVLVLALGRGSQARVLENI